MGVPTPAVLEDPTGTRARWLRRAGRVVFLLFLAWLLTIVLGGLGLVPIAGLPLTHVLRPSQGPPPLAKLPKPRQPSAADLQPALPAKAFAANVASSSHGRSALAPGKTKATPAAARSQKGRATAPGQLAKTSTSSTTHGRSSSAPGHTKRTTTTATVSPGKRAAAPGRTKTTPVATHQRGRSASGPGKTQTTTTAHGRSGKP